MVLGIACLFATQAVFAASLRLSPRVQSLLPDATRRSLHKLVAKITQRTASKPEVALYFEQLGQLRDSLAEAESFAFGAFSYFFRGTRKGQPSGDFIDTTPLSDGRLLIRFGDVMGHDKRGRNNFLCAAKNHA